MKTCPRSRPASAQTGIQVAARRVRCALSRLRACVQVSVRPDRAYTPPDAPVAQLRKLHAASWFRARGDRACELPRHRHERDARCDCVERRRLPGHARSSTADQRQRVGGPPFSRHPRHPLQFRAPSRRGPRREGGRNAGAANRAARLACRAAFDAQDIVEQAATSDCQDQRAVRDRPHGARRRRPTVSTRRRFACCAISCAANRSRG